MAEKISGEDSGGRARWRRCGTTGMYTAAEEMRGRQHMIYGTMEMAKWVGRTANGLRKYRQGTTTEPRGVIVRSDNSGAGATTTDLRIDSICVWRPCVSYHNLNKITRPGLSNPSWARFRIMSSFTPGEAKYRITKGESQPFDARQLRSCLSLRIGNKIDYELFVSISS